MSRELFVRVCVCRYSPSWIDLRKSPPILLTKHKLYKSVDMRGSKMTEKDGRETVVEVERRCDVMQFDGCPWTTHHTHLDTRTHTHRHFYRLVAVPQLWLNMGEVTCKRPWFPCWCRLGRKGKSCWCLPADPTCYTRPADPLFLSHLSPVQPILSAQNYYMLICLLLRTNMGSQNPNKPIIDVQKFILLPVKRCKYFSFFARL